jgi:SAM-dependent methyltransferase
MPYLIAPLRNISAIYGAEPCVGLHTTLRQRILSNGLDGKYHIVPSSVEKTELMAALERHHGVVQTEAEKGIFDTILCVRVLCSVPDPAHTIADLYTLLRPGGQMLVVEHVVNPFPRKGSSLFSRVMQFVYGCMGWSFFLGNCHLNRDTMTHLLKAADRDGGWESLELEQRWPWSTLPYISGVLVKKP